MSNTTIEREFLESIDCSEAQFIDDPQRPMLRRVKILGTISENDREYTLEAKSDAIGRKLYENARVNINHPDDPHKSRGFEDRFGFLTNVGIEERDIYGNMSWNPQHPWANTFKWWAQNAPNCIGLSHNAVGQGRDDNGKFIVEKIVKVRSVDLVADPATTKSLFEARNPMSEDTKKTQDNQNNVTKTETVQETKTENKTVDSLELRMGNAVCGILKDSKLTTEDKIHKLLLGTKLITEDQKVKVKKVSEEDESEEEKKKKEEEEKKKKDEDKKEEKKVEESVSKLNADTSLKELCESVIGKLDTREKFYADRVDALEAKRAYESAKDKGRKLCQESKLPEKLVTTVFLHELAECKDEKEMKEMINDKKAVLEEIRAVPPSAPKKQAKDIATDDFVSALKGSKKLDLQ